MPRRRLPSDDWGAGDNLVTSNDGSEIADRLVDLLASTGCDSLNLRVFHAGTTPAQVRRADQQVGTEVVPRLRTLLSGDGPVAPA